MQENSLHLSLKKYFSGETGQQEVLLDGYWIDVVQDDLLIEVQTRSFTSIKKKLNNLMQSHRLLLVHPIPVIKWIIQWTNEGDETISRRKSPRKGRIEHLFNELIRFPEFIQHPNFNLCAVLTQEEEIRRKDGLGSWRRKGASIVDRKLLKVLQLQYFSQPEDFLSLLPDNLPTTFTNQELSKASRIRVELARKMTYCLRQMGCLEVCGKQKRELLYKVCTQTYNPTSIQANGEPNER